MPPRSRRGRLWALVLGLGFAQEGHSSRPEPPRVDLSRLKIGAERVTAPTRGSGLAELTLDPQLQRVAERLLEQARPHQGALVALDPRSGRIVAWSEVPRRGPDPVATTANMPAASVFKVVTAAALFEANAIHPSERVCVSGGVRAIEREHLDRPMAGRVHCTPFFEALGHSRNAVFAQLATQRLLRNELLAVAGRLGFNASVPFDWEVPLGRLSVPYDDLSFARTAAGFQGSTLSTLGGAFLASIVANAGLAHKLRMVARADNYLAPDEPELVGRVLSRTTAWRLMRMMEVTVHSGTCLSSFTDAEGRNFLPGIRVAGKTGTLQPDGRETTISWFIGFAPSRKPQIAVSVMLQNGPIWRKRAAEVARDLLLAHFQRARKIERPVPPEVVAGR